MRRQERQAQVEQAHVAGVFGGVCWATLVSSASRIRRVMAASRWATAIVAIAERYGTLAANVGATIELSQGGRA